jgi:hypothetical protein
MALLSLKGLNMFGGRPQEWRKVDIILRRRPGIRCMELISVLTHDVHFLLLQTFLPYYI